MIWVFGSIAFFAFAGLLVSLAVGRLITFGDCSLPDDDGESYP